MNCTKCGNELDTGAAFCGNCGQAASASQQSGPLPVVTPPVPQAPSVVPPPPPTFQGQPPALQPAPQPSSPVAPGSLPPYAVARPSGGQGTLAIVAFVISLLSLPLIFLPVIGIVAGLAAVIMGIVVKPKRGLAIAALVIGAIGFVLSIVMLILTVVVRVNQLQQSGAGLLLQSLHI